MSASWTIFLVITGLLVVGIVVWVIGLYNSLIQVKHQVDQAWANVDVLLKQRSDELGKLLDTVRVFMTHERDMLERLTRLRTEVARGGDGEARLAAEQAIGRETARLMVSAEAYPDLRSSELFRGLQQRIAAVEEQIAHRREYLNAAVNINNIKLEQLPDAFLASTAGLHRRPLFAATEEERQDVNVRARLAS